MFVIIWLIPWCICLLTNQGPNQVKWENFQRYTKLFRSYLNLFILNIIHGFAAKCIKSSKCQSANPHFHHFHHVEKLIICIFDDVTRCTTKWLKVRCFQLLFNFRTMAKNFKMSTLSLTRRGKWGLKQKLDFMIDTVGANWLCAVGFLWSKMVKIRGIFWNLRVNSKQKRLC